MTRATGNILSDSEYVYDTNNRLTSLHGQQISYDADDPTTIFDRLGSLL